MIVKRVIVKDVNRCSECPYYGEDHDMGSTRPYCDAIEGNWEDKDIPTYDEPNKRISSKCPINNQ